MSGEHPASLLPRHEAFLRCEKVDRPLLGAWVGGYYPAEQFPRGHQSWQPGQSLRPADVCFDGFRQDYETLYRLHQEAEDDFFYVGSAYWGIPWLEAILGCPIHVGETSCWAGMCLRNPHDVSQFRSDVQNNPWFQCLLHFTEHLLQFAAGRFPVCAPLLRGPGDAACALCGPEAVAMGLIDGAAWVRELLAACTRVRREVLEHLHRLIPAWHGTHAAGGYPSKVWTARQVAYYQEDAAAVLNPALFAGHLLPLARQTKPLAEVHFIHLHSSCLYPLDALLTDDTFSVLEVNLDHPGSSPPLAQYLPALRRIQQAHRSLVLWGEIRPSDWNLLREALSPVGLSIQPIIARPDEVQRYRWV
ncbi:MAG: hypothetical protein MUC88_14090 [Planctomycetes bacterium]|jgi:hypothetical protein|nr:hypothetical protein [Planctomycetota bacterium]